MRAEYVLVPSIHGVFSDLFYLEVDIRIKESFFEATMQKNHASDCVASAKTYFPCLSFFHCWGLCWSKDPFLQKFSLRLGWQWR